MRVIQTNGIDLSLFQFDCDLTWCVFFLNADRTVYGRYGTRGAKDSSEHLHIDGFTRSLQGALQLHKEYPGNKDALASKTGPKPTYAAPELFPPLKSKFTTNLQEGATDKVRRSCIHCHMIQEAQRTVARSAGKAIPAEVLYPYPMPDAVGLSLDPGQRATVEAVRADSPGHKAGFRTGDDLVRLNGQPILSIADVQWVLHHARDGDTLTAAVRREGKPVELRVTLPAGWRRGDISWRPSTWDLRRMVLGGLVLEDLGDAERKQRKLPAEGMAFRIKHIGQFGQHAAGKNAGFRNEDVLVAVDGRESRRTESALIEELLRSRKLGDQVEVTVQRGGKAVMLKLPIQ